MRQTTSRHIRRFFPFPTGPLAVLSIVGLLVFSGCASYGPAPPVVVSAPTSEGAGSVPAQGLVPLLVLPTQTPSDMTDVGTLYHQDGSYSQLVPRDPVAPALDAILVNELKKAGYDAVLSPAPAPKDAPTLSLKVTVFEDSVRQSLVEAKQTARIEFKATLVIHEGRTTRTITRKIARHLSPKPVISFDPDKLSALMGELFAKSLREDLIPSIKAKTGASQ